MDIVFRNGFPVFQVMEGHDIRTPAAKCEIWKSENLPLFADSPYCVHNEDMKVHGVVDPEVHRQEAKWVIRRIFGDGETVPGEGSMFHCTCGYSDLFRKFVVPDWILRLGLCRCGRIHVRSMRRIDMQLTDVRDLERSAEEAIAAYASLLRKAFERADLDTHTTFARVYASDRQALGYSEKILTLAFPTGLPDEDNTAVASSTKGVI